MASHGQGQRLTDDFDNSNGYFLRIARLLGFLDGVVEATNPLNTGIGRIRAEQDVPKRVRLG